MRWIVLALALGVVLAAAGCSRAQGHTLLTIFFEGVPPLEGERPSGELPPATATAPPPRSGAELGSSPASPKSRPKMVVTTHVPFRLKLCNACHPVSIQEKGSLPRLDFKGKSILLKPVPDLCYGCHTDKVPTAEALAQGWMHGPVADGACIFCHNPHSTRTPNLLKASPTAKLCQRCHKPGLMHLGEAPKPAEGQDCTACHSGHMGNTRFLLKPPAEQKTSRPGSPLAPSGPTDPLEPTPTALPKRVGGRLSSSMRRAPLVAVG